MLNIGKRRLDQHLLIPECFDWKFSKALGEGVLALKKIEKLKKWLDIEIDKNDKIFRNDNLRLDVQDTAFDFKKAYEEVRLLL